MPKHASQELQSDHERAAEKTVGGDNAGTECAESKCGASVGGERTGHKVFDCQDDLEDILERGESRQEEAEAVLHRNCTQKPTVNGMHGREDGAGDGGSAGDAVVGEAAGS